MMIISFDLARIRLDSVCVHAQDCFLFFFLTMPATDKDDDDNFIVKLFFLEHFIIMNE